MALAEPIARRGDWQRSGECMLQREAWINATRKAAAGTQSGNRRHKSGGLCWMICGGRHKPGNRRRITGAPRSRGMVPCSTRTAAAAARSAGRREHDDRKRNATNQCSRNTERNAADVVCIV